MTIPGTFLGPFLRLLRSRRTTDVKKGMTRTENKKRNKTIRKHMDFGGRLDMRSVRACAVETHFSIQSMLLKLSKKF